MEELKNQLPSQDFPDKGIVTEVRRVFIVKGQKLRSLRTSCGMSLRMLATYLTERTGIIYDHKGIDRLERLASFETDQKTIQALINLPAVAKMTQTAQKREVQ